MKDFQIQILSQIRSGYMLVLGLRSSAIPSWGFDFHLEFDHYSSNTAGHAIAANWRNTSPLYRNKIHRKKLPAPLPD
jgi:hypothetical protein